jgi:hypothetical protein
VPRNSSRHTAARVPDFKLNHDLWPIKSKNVLKCTRLMGGSGAIMKVGKRTVRIGSHARREDITRRSSFDSRLCLNLIANPFFSSCTTRLQPLPLKSHYYASIQGWIVSRNSVSHAVARVPEFKLNHLIEQWKMSSKFIRLMGAPGVIIKAGKHTVCIGGY